MSNTLLYSTLITVSICSVAVAQSVGPDDAFQVRYASNLTIGDGVVNMTNTGTSGGNICVNIYTFDSSEELVSCCACGITPDGLQSLSVRNSLISNTLTPAVPSSVVIKLLASSGSTCNAATVTADVLAPGMRAWGTTIHQLPTATATYGVTESEFLNATLTSAELTHVTSFCQFIQEIGGGYGICRGCVVGGLGAIPTP
jgi:hypothetical protein